MTAFVERVEAEYISNFSFSGDRSARSRERSREHAVV